MRKLDFDHLKVAYSNADVLIVGRGKRFWSTKYQKLMVGCFLSYRRRPKFDPIHLIFGQKLIY